MGRLIYALMTSLDGYTEDADGQFGWGFPEDEQVHGYFNALDRTIGTYLYGRRMYETMAYWETAHELPDLSPVALEWALQWQQREKVVYSRTLEATRAPRTRLERSFDAAAVQQMKARSEKDLGIGGPELAAHALKAGLVDEVQQVVCPLVVGGGKRFFPEGLRLRLEPLEQRRFPSGAVLLRYALRS